MGYFRMELDGSGGALRALDALSNIPQIAREALQAGADVLLPAEIAAAPVGPGNGEHIRNRLETRLKTNGGRPVALVGVWDEPVAYYVERGHGGPHPAPAHPYMEPTADEKRDEVWDAVMDVVNKWLDGDGG